MRPPPFARVICWIAVPRRIAERLPDWATSVASPMLRRRQSEAACSGDGRRTLTDASAHRPISASQMISCSQAGRPVPGATGDEVKGEYAYHPNLSPPPRLTRYLPTAASASPRATTTTTPLSLAQSVNQVHMANPARDGDLARPDEGAHGLAARSGPIQIIGAEG
jgi:hypothetical protein